MRLSELFVIPTNAQAAKEGLIEAFQLTDVQAQAIVDMRLRALTGLEREKLENEFKELQAKNCPVKRQFWQMRRSFLW